jgi:hypothetical protein
LRLEDVALLPLAEEADSAEGSDVADQKLALAALAVSQRTLALPPVRPRWLARSLHQDLEVPSRKASRLLSRVKRA